MRWPHKCASIDWPVQRLGRSPHAEAATDTPAGFKQLLARDGGDAGNVVRVSGARVE